MIVFATWQLFDVLLIMRGSLPFKVSQTKSVTNVPINTNNFQSVTLGSAFTNIDYLN